MEQILLPNSLPKETITAIMILDSNKKSKVRLLVTETKYFDIFAGVLQRDTCAPYLFIICQNYALRMLIDQLKEKG